MFDCINPTFAMNFSFIFLAVFLASTAPYVRAQEIQDAVNVETGETVAIGGQSNAPFANIYQRFKRQACVGTDQWSNCAVDLVYQGTTYKALFPGGAGCATVAGTSSSMLSYACQCTKTCPAFCGAAACGATTTTKATGSGTTTKATTATPTTIKSTTTKSTTTAAPTTGLDTSLPGVQSTIVNLHNAKRRIIASPTTLKLSWDTEIAAIAQAWANQCTFAHPGKTLSQYWKTSKFSSTGQNLAQGTALTWTDSINMWYDEVNNFKFGVGTTDPSKAVGHYTQLVWNATYAVGCGYKQCPSWKIFACNYGPGGNIMPNENYPYLAGPACTGTGTCDAGLRTNPCPYVNVYSNCEVSQPGYPALYPKGCGTPATGGMKDSCQATCLCKPQGLLYRL